MKNITGQIFGRLTALTRIGGKQGLWKFKCECGNLVYVAMYSVKSGNTISCGCAKKKLKPGEYTYNQLFSTTRYSAKLRKLTFELTKEEHLELIRSNCYYDGTPPREYKHTRDNTSIFINGIDRVDNSKGYTKDNCVACCEQCNMAKREYTAKEFIEHCIKVAEFQRSKK